MQNILQDIKLQSKRFSLSLMGCLQSRERVPKWKLNAHFGDPNGALKHSIFPHGIFYVKSRSGWLKQ